MSRKKPHLRYPLKDSCLYKIATRRKLAAALRVDLTFANAQTRFATPYREFDLKGRWIEDPKPGLKQIHSRFAYLLSCIETPTYLHSAVKERSYVTNAVGHDATTATGKLDVKKFFPSARSVDVYRFFNSVLEWPVDVAALGTALFTWRGHLPTGGNASPILSFWAYKPMFDEIAVLAANNNCLFSLYVDDMTLTGSLATRKLLHQARKIVGAHQLRAHKFHNFGPREPRVVTGVAKTVEGTRLPYRRQKLIAQAQLALKTAQTDQDKLAAFRPLVGRLCEAVQVDPPTWRPHAYRVLAQLRDFHVANTL